MAAKYLVRFDDICPSMNWEVWDQVERVLTDFQVAPILAVVPDNRDPMLKITTERHDFWARVRQWQARGWTIGLHGYQHVYVTREAGLVRINRRSEFAGLGRSVQQEKLAKAMKVFRDEQVQAGVWIAPGHSFDQTTLEVLKELGVTDISDGFGVFPYRDAMGMFWMPQQLWRFRNFAFGIWTVCYHVNTWSAVDVSSFRESIERFRERISAWTSIKSEYSTRRRRFVDVILSEAMMMGLHARRILTRPG